MLAHASGSMLASPLLDERIMYKTPSQLSESARVAVAEVLNASLADGLDLHSQLKVAHWNVKGPQFAALHPLFETFATTLAAFDDAIAERAVILGARALGTLRHVAKTSRLADYPLDTSRDLDHVRLIADRIETYLVGLRAGRTVAEKHADVDTVDLFTTVISEFEKNAWFLRASLETA
jgi:starvation-inducible DNA-binding protein